MRHYSFPMALGVALTMMAAASLPVSAQDLTITNVRIIGPDASVVERGTIVVRGGIEAGPINGGTVVVDERSVDTRAK